MSAPSLKFFQQQFKAAIKTSLSPEDFLKTNSGKSLISWIQTSSKDTPLQRLAVYRDAYDIRLFESLKTNFKTTFEILGDKQSLKFVTQYMRETPSKHADLGDVGHSFSKFLRTQNTAHDFPFLSDLARFESCILKSFHAKNLPACTVEHLKAELENNTPTDLTFSIQNACVLFQSGWNIYDIWKFKKKPCRHSQHILMFRPEFQVQVEALTPIAFDILSLLTQGKTLGEACSSLESLSTYSLEKKIQKWFQEWMQKKLFIQIKGPNHHGTS
jgi:hypothetical protein